MKELINLLRQNERKALAVLLVAVVAAILFANFIARPARTTYLRATRSLSSLEKNLKESRAGRRDKRLEWSRWRQAVGDMKTLSTDYFYKEASATQEIRQGLEEILQDSGIPTPEISYRYVQFRAEKINKIEASFDISGFYYLIKKFLYAVEVYPKFLMIERIEFRDIDRKTGRLRLRINLAGYYEE